MREDTGSRTEADAGRFEAWLHQGDENPDRPHPWELDNTGPCATGDTDTVLDQQLRRAIEKAREAW